MKFCLKDKDNMIISSNIYYNEHRCRMSVFTDINFVNHNEYIVNKIKSECLTEFSLNIKILNDLNCYHFSFNKMAKDEMTLKFRNEVKQDICNYIKKLYDKIADKYGLEVEIIND